MKKLTTNVEFITKANLKHNYKYEYNKVFYVNSKSKVLITCKTHGDFFQAPHKHLFGNGCRKCANVTRWNVRGRTDFFMFLNKAQAIHKNLYEYPSNQLISNGQSPIKVICKIHGEFITTSTLHTNYKYGCPVCAGNKIKTNEEFVEQAKAIHGDTYTYTNFLYVNSKSPSYITCKYHGDFLQTSDSHINAESGCGKCAPRGLFSDKYFIRKPEFKTKPAILYLIKIYNETEEFYKIGLTTKSVKHRFKNFVYKIEVVLEINSNLYNVWQKEQQILKDRYLDKYIPAIKFKGESECFTKESFATIYNEAAQLKGII